MLLFTDSKSSQNKNQYCKHETLNTFGQFSNCQKCGIYIPLDKTIKCYRSQQLNTECSVDIPRHYKSLCQEKSQKIEINTSNFTDFYRKSREEIILLITEIGQKLNFSLSTMHLAIFYMDFINSKEQLTETSLKVYAVTCSMLACLFLMKILYYFCIAKAIELDEKIPFISKLRKNSSLTYRASDIKKAERHIISLLEWKLQIPTLYELIQNYLSIGILFSNDKLPSISEQSFLKPIENKFQQMKISEKKDTKQIVDENLLKELPKTQIQELLSKIDKEAMRLTNMIMRDSSMLNISKETIALACICFLRKSIGIENYWNDEFKVLSFGLCQSDIESTIQLLIQKFEKFFQPIETTSNYQIVRASPTYKLSSQVFQKIRQNNMPNSQYLQQNQLFNENFPMMTDNFF